MRPGMRFERKIRRRVRDESGFTCEKRKVIGQSGNIWEVDGVIFKGDSPVSYLEVKYIGERSSYPTQYRLALAQLTDFRYSSVPGAVIVPEKRNPGNKNWEDYLATIGCVLIGENQLGDFLDSLIDFPTAPEASDPLEDFISERVWENVGDEPLKFADEKEVRRKEQTLNSLDDIVNEHFD